MKKIIDLQTFQKITTDCMRVHETVRSTEPLTAEAERILQLADSLLREAGLAYLNEGQNLDVPGLPNSEQATPPEQVVENFIGVQHALVDLKQALYQLAKTHLAEQRWPELATSINALIYLGEDGSDVSSVVKDIENTFIELLQTQVAEQKWSELVTSLKALRSLGKDGPNVYGVEKAIEETFVRLVKTHLAEQRWSELATLFNALSSLEKNVPNISSMVKTVNGTLNFTVGNFVEQARDLFRSEEWDKGRTLLKPLLFVPRVRSDYYCSYVTQSYLLKDPHPLIELKRQLPAKASTNRLDLCSRYLSDSKAFNSDACTNALVEVHEIVTDPDFNPNQVSSSDGPSR